MSKLYVVSAGRNATRFINKCIVSVQQQTLSCDSHIVIDDLSDDDTLAHLSQYMMPNLDIKINKERKYRLKNIYENVIDKDPEDIICIVDSDDWLTSVTALEKIKNVYDSNKKIEYVHSRFIMSGGQLGGSQPIPSEKWDPYSSKWITSHISTFKVKALKPIPIENFLHWNGERFKIATDHALTLPILYRLWKRDGDYSAVGFIDEPLYTHLFYGNPSKPRSGTKEADDRSALSIKCSTYIKQRRYIE